MLTRTLFDVAKHKVCFSLSTKDRTAHTLEGMVALGYDYCGLLENDVKLGAGWFEAVLGLFQTGRDDGLEVGAASAYCFNRWILYNRGTYAVTLISGATMVLFTRQAAQLVLDHYRTTTTTEIFEWVRFASGMDPRPDDASTDPRGSSDLTYAITLQKHALVA